VYKQKCAEGPTMVGSPHVCTVHTVASLMRFYNFQETHIIHKFDADFYNSWLRVIICGFLRPMENYKSLGKQN
jgi:FAD synthase